MAAQLSALSGDLQETVAAWLLYKQERREAYKPQGLHAFLQRLQQFCDSYGDAAVADLIRSAMANGYKGVSWDRLAMRYGKQPAPRPKKSKFSGVEDDLL